MFKNHEHLDVLKEANYEELLSESSLDILTQEHIEREKEKFKLSHRFSSMLQDQGVVMKDPNLDKWFT